MEQELDALASGVGSTVARWCKGGAERERVARRVSGTW